MNRAIQQKLLLCFLMSVVLFIAVKIICPPLLRNLSASPVHQKSAPLPDDVESVLSGYKYLDTNFGLKIDISGKQIIRRGKRILGLRSNLAKSNFFEEIHGTVGGPKATVAFSASDAEWDADTTHPLVLKKNVSVTVNNETFSPVKTAKIFFHQGLVEVTTDQPKMYELK